MFEGVVFKEDLVDYTSGGSVAHSGLSGLASDDHVQYLLASGTRALSGDWDAGSHKITAETFESDVSTGTAPLTVASTTVVTNLNADKVDGKDETAFLLVNGTRPLTGNWGVGAFNIDLNSQQYIRGYAPSAPSLYNLIGFNGSNVATVGSGNRETQVLGTTKVTVNPKLVTDEITHETVDHGIVLGATLRAPIATVTNGTTGIDNTYFTVLCDASSGTVTINLPTGAGYTGTVFNIKCIDDTNTVTITPDGTDEIDAVNSSITLVQDEVITIQYDGSNWWII